MPLLYRRLFTRSSNHLFFPKCPHSQASSLNPLRLLHHTHHQRLLLLLPKPLSGPLLSPGTSHDFLSVKPFLLFREVHLALRGYKVVRDPLALLRSKLEEEGILCGEMKLGLSMRELCPQCKGGNSMEKSLSILIQENGELALWICFRATCGWRGYINASGKGNNYCPINPISKVKKRRNLSEEDLCLEPLCNELLAYFSARMISEETLRRNAVLQRNWDDRIAIAFPYRQDGKVVSCKYRDITKKIWQEKDTEKIFYGVDDIKEASDILIVEGEIDKLSMEEAGFCNCVSVPDGAPVEISDKVLPSEDKDTAYQYLWNCRKYIEKASRIILATDADAPGQALAEELARRLGRERCWRVTWPMKNETDVCKDANEVLMYLGREALKNVIENAELYPIRGLFTFSDYFHEIDAYYRCCGYELGVSTGWKALNDLYKVTPGELTIVTGVPNSGKSEWIDAMMCNINERERWKFALCSMENKVQEHARKLLEKHIKKPFFTARYEKNVECISKMELEEGKKWLNETFHLIRCENDSLPSINWILKLAKVAVLRHGVRGLVIDPYNELDHQRPFNQTETEYVSQILTKIKCFAQHHSCHVWFVAHPRQLQHWSGMPPSIYDISGSAHFINKCDNGIVVHRNRNPKLGPLDRVLIYVRKVRNKVMGSIGVASLLYDRITGEFKDINDELVK